MDIQFNENVLKRFAALEQKGQLAHAYLFTGPAYIGKGATALAAAQFLNCGHKDNAGGKYFCGECPSCRKVLSGNHPDVHVLEGAPGQTIKIDEIRELLAQSRLRPFMAERKIFIIHHVENMTIEAANALLKTLEEPTASSLLILTSAVPERVPETVKSRCHTMPFLPLSRRELAARLVRHYQEEDGAAHFLAYFAEGCLGKARRLKESGIKQKRDEIIDRFILGREREPLIKEVAADKEKTRVFLDVLLSWVRDCLLVKSGAGDNRLVNADRVRDIRGFQRQFSFADLAALHAELVHTCRLLLENLNVKIPLMIIGERLWAR
ncbi:MAG: DNA polymerase III subunit delta' [Candidatus Omnitrophica bacterium]|nr:DNA polymerase III subunit delta' [Candidatus Omnitrophota bacterium]